LTAAIHFYWLNTSPIFDQKKLAYTLISDMILFLLIPANYLPVLANIGLIVTLLYSKNPMLEYLKGMGFRDFTDATWVSIFMIELFRPIPVPFKFLRLFGVHGVTLGIYSANQILDNFVAKNLIISVSGWIIFLSLDYYYAIPFEWLFCAAFIFYSTWKNKLPVANILAPIVISDLLLFAIVPSYILGVFANISLLLTVFFLIPKPNMSQSTITFSVLIIFEILRPKITLLYNIFHLFAGFCPALGFFSFFVFIANLDFRKRITYTPIKENLQQIEQISQSMFNVIF